MFTPKELVYINTMLEKENRGIWTRFNNCYEVAIKAQGKYVLEFSGQPKAIEFEQRLVMDNAEGFSMANGVITIYKKSEKAIYIKCGNNEQLANKLTKHLRKQYVLNVRQTLQDRAKIEKPTQQQINQEIENTGLKF